MSRKVPPMSFRLQLHRFDQSVGVVIDAIESFSEDEEVSSGFLVIYDTDDIFILKDSIDRFIEDKCLTRPEQ